MKCKTYENLVKRKYYSSKECYDFLKVEAPSMKYFNWRSSGDAMCSSCVSAYDGSNTDLEDDTLYKGNLYYVAPTAKSAISVKQGDSIYTCASTDATKCEFTQGDATSMPVVESLTKTDTTIVFTGQNFEAGLFPGGKGVTAKVSFMGIESKSVIIDSATQVTATFDMGVPTTSLNTQIPKLYFEDADYYVPSTGKCTPKSRTRVISDYITSSETGEDKCSPLCDADPDCYGFYWVVADTKCSLWTSPDGVKGDGGTDGEVCKVKIHKVATIYAIST